MNPNSSNPQHQQPIYEELEDNFQDFESNSDFEENREKDFEENKNEDSDGYLKPEHKKIEEQEYTYIDEKTFEKSKGKIQWCSCCTWRNNC